MTKVFYFSKSNPLEPMEKAMERLNDMLSDIGNQGFDIMGITPFVELGKSAGFVILTKK